MSWHLTFEDTKENMKTFSFLNVLNDFVFRQATERSELGLHLCSLQSSYELSAALCQMVERSMNGSCCAFAHF